MKAINKISIMKTLITLLILSFGISSASNVSAQQKYYTNKASIHFLSKALIEDIEAFNEMVVCIVNVETGEMAFKAPINKFEFEKSLMKEHFNENYMDSEKFPHATFSGTITDLPQLDMTVNNQFDVQVQGDLTIHGVTQSISEAGTIEILDGNLKLYSEFVVRLKDYKVKIPKIVFQNIAEKLDVTIKAELQLYEK